MKCPICRGVATVISTTGIRVHFCPQAKRNVWWKRSLFLVTHELTEYQVARVIVDGYPLRKISHKSGDR